MRFIQDCLWSTPNTQLSLLTARPGSSSRNARSSVTANWTACVTTWKIPIGVPSWLLSDDSSLLTTETVSFWSLDMISFPFFYFLDRKREILIHSTIINNWPCRYFFFSSSFYTNYRSWRAPCFSDWKRIADSSSRVDPHPQGFGLSRPRRHRLPARLGPADRSRYGYGCRV